MMRYALLLLISLWFVCTVNGQHETALKVIPEYQIGVRAGAGFASPRHNYSIPIYEVGIQFSFPVNDHPKNRIELFVQYNKDQFYEEAYSIPNSDVLNFGTLYSLALYHGNRYRIYFAPGLVAGIKCEYHYKYKVIWESEEYVVSDMETKGEKKLTLHLPIFGPIVSVKQEVRITNNLCFQLSLNAMSQLDMFRYKLLSPELKSSVTASAGFLIGFPGR